MSYGAAMGVRSVYVERPACRLRLFVTMPLPGVIPPRLPILVDRNGSQRMSQPAAGSLSVIPDAYLLAVTLPQFTEFGLQCLTRRLFFPQKRFSFQASLRIFVASMPSFVTSTPLPSRVWSASRYVRRYSPRGQCQRTRPDHSPGVPRAIHWCLQQGDHGQPNMAGRS